MYKLLVFTELYYPEETSTGYILTNIFEILAQNHQVEVITSPLADHFQNQDFLRKKVHNSVDIIRCGGSSLDKNLMLGRMINILTRTASIFGEGLKRCVQENVVFVVTNPPTLPFVVFLIAKLKGCQYILIIHDVYPDVLDVLGYGKWLPGLNFLWRQVNQLIYKNATNIVVLGRDMAQRIEQNYLTVDCDQKKLVCIHNWAELETVFPDDRASNPLLRQLTLNDKFVVLYAGNLGRTHGVEVFAEAMRKLRDRDDIHFLTIAAGQKRPWLQQFINEHSLSNTTLIPLEDRPRSEQNVSLNAGDVAIISFIPGMAGISVPSRMYNCMAAGKPILAVADTESELAQVIVEEDIGWVVTPENVDGLVKTIEYAASHPQVCAEMGQRAVVAARSKYTFEQAIAGYRDLLKNLGTEHS